MKGFAHDKRFGHLSLRAHRYACLLIDDISEPRPGFYRCHEIARFVFEGLDRLGFLLDGDRVIDGWHVGSEHSWIALWGSIAESEGGQQVILDPYAVGRFPIVQLVDVSSPLLLRDQYREEEPRTDIRHDVMEFLRTKLPNQPGKTT